MKIRMDGKRTKKYSKRNNYVNGSLKDKKRTFTGPLFKLIIDTYLYNIW